MSRWQPIASMVTTAPSIAIRSSSFGTATISLDFSATLTCPSTRRWRENGRRRAMAETDTSSVPSHPLIESDHIEGTAVYDANGKQIGTIKRLVIEKVSGHVVYAVTSFGGFLGVGSETHSIPWGQLHYDTTFGGYKTNITEEQLRKAPEFSRGDESLLSGHERQQLGDYYIEPW